MRKATVLAALAALAAITSLLAPASAASASPQPAGATTSAIVVAGAGDWQIINIYNAYGVRVGFVYLETSSDRRYRKLEICDQANDGLSIHGQIDPADASGGSTGNLITYTDAWGGGCYLRDLYYPIRKFRALIGSAATDWAPPPPL